MLIIYFTYFILLKFTTVIIFHNEKKCEIYSVFCNFTHYVIQVLWLLASKQPQYLYDIYLMLYLVLDS